MKSFFKYLAVFVCGAALGIIISFVFVFKDAKLTSPSINPSPAYPQLSEEFYEQFAKKLIEEKKEGKGEQWFADKMKADAEERKKSADALDKPDENANSLFDKFADPKKSE